MANIEELIGQLRDFRTRAAAKGALLNAGDEAVGPLITALDDRSENVRWSAADLLGDLGAKDAVPKLIEELDDVDVRGAAAGALSKITRQNFGEDRKAWEQWAASSGMAGDDPQAEAESDADLVRKAVYNTNIAATESGPGYVLCVPMGDRHQDVTVNFGAQSSDGAALVVVYTRCGPANAKHYEWALRQNVKMAAGAIAIADIEGKPNFVVVDVLSRATVTARILVDSVQRVARKGDKLEAALTKADAY
jgi:hypothetical protein